MWTPASSCTARRLPSDADQHDLGDRGVLLDLDAVESVEKTRSSTVRNGATANVAWPVRLEAEPVNRALYGRYAVPSKITTSRGGSAMTSCADAPEVEQDVLLAVDRRPVLEVALRPERAVAGDGRDVGVEQAIRLQEAQRRVGEDAGVRPERAEEARDRGRLQDRGDRGARMVVVAERQQVAGHDARP